MAKSSEWRERCCRDETATNIGKGSQPVERPRGQNLRVFVLIKRRKPLKASHPELRVHKTYGCRTKHARIANGIAKSHCAHAFCIAGYFGAERLSEFFFRKQIHKLPSSMAPFESAIRYPSKSRVFVFLTRLPAGEQKASFSAVDLPGALMFESLTEPAFQPASATRSCVCWKRDEPI